jgi:hypothetical protein
VTVLLARRQLLLRAFRSTADLPRQVVRLAGVDVAAEDGRGLLDAVAVGVAVRSASTVDGGDYRFELVLEGVVLRKEMS